MFVMKDLSSEKRKVIIRIFAAVVVSCLLFVGYIAVLQPMVGNPFVPYTIYHDPALFVPEVYGSIEKGDMFAEKFYSYVFSNKCEVIEDFYYIDNRTKDSFLYGKRPDVYALTLDAGEYYNEIAAYIRENGEYIAKDGVDGEGTLYYLMPTSGLVSDRFVFRVGETVNALQFILVTEISEEDIADVGGAWNIMPTIFYWSGIQLDTYMP